MMSIGLLPLAVSGSRAKQSEPHSGPKLDVYCQIAIQGKPMNPTALHDEFRGLIFTW